MINRFRLFGVLLAAILFSAASVVRADTVQLTVGSGFFMACKGAGTSSGAPCFPQDELVDSAGADMTSAAGTSASSRALAIQGIIGGVPMPTAPQAAATGGAAHGPFASAASTNATVLKASAGTLYHYGMTNSSTTVVGFIAFFDTATTPTCTATPAYGPILIPEVGSTGNLGGGISEDFSVGMAFTTGISYCVFTAVGGTGSTAANQITGGFLSK